MFSLFRCCVLDKSSNGKLRTSSSRLYTVVDISAYDWHHLFRYAFDMVRESYIYLLQKGEDNAGGCRMIKYRTSEPNSRIHSVTSDTETLRTTVEWWIILPVMLEVGELIVPRSVFFTNASKLLWILKSTFVTFLYSSFSINQNLLTFPG